MHRRDKGVLKVPIPGASTAVATPVKITSRIRMMNRAGVLLGRIPEQPIPDFVPFRCIG